MGMTGIACHADATVIRQMASLRSGRCHRGLQYVKVCEKDLLHPHNSFRADC